MTISLILMFSNLFIYFFILFFINNLLCSRTWWIIIFDSKNYVMTLIILLLMTEIGLPLNPGFAGWLFLHVSSSKHCVPLYASNGSLVSIISRTRHLDHHKISSSSCPSPLSHLSLFYLYYSSFLLNTLGPVRFAQRSVCPRSIYTAGACVDRSEQNIKY